MSLFFSPLLSVRVLFFSIVVCDCPTSNVKLTPVFISNTCVCLAFVIKFDRMYRFHLVVCLYAIAMGQSLSRRKVEYHRPESAP